MWFYSTRKSTHIQKDTEISSKGRRKSLSDITCDVINRTAPTSEEMQGLQLTDSGQKEDVRNSNIYFTRDPVKNYHAVPSSSSELHHHKRAVVAGTKPFRFMIEATVEVQSTSHP